MQSVALTAQIRKRTGKGMARSLRRQALVPAVFYGPNVAPVPLTVRPKDLEKLLSTGSGEHILIDLTIADGRGEQNHRAMIKEIQVDPIKRKLLHVDFFAISLDKKITVEIQINLRGVPAGATEGGILQQVRRSIAIFCLPDRIPSGLDLDVSSLDIGDSLHISDLDIPEGVELLDEERLTVVNVLAPTRVEEEPETPEEGEEVEAEATETEEEGE